jgi:hypothetical protein
MVHSNILYNRLKPYLNKHTILVHNQDTSNIINGLLDFHKQYESEYDKIAGAFAGRTPRETGKKIWNFLKTNTRYVVEPDSKQTLRSPSAILYTGKKFGIDCKNLSLFTGGILDALNRKGNKINWCYRFASYKYNDKLPHHVFVVINPNTNDEIWVDAVLDAYNDKKQYFYKTDKTPNMALISMAGIGRKSKAERKENRKAKVQKVKQAIKKAGKVVLKLNPASVTARNSFLGLVKLNVFSLASKLNDAMNKSNDLFNLWQQIGGDITSLKKSIEVGRVKRSIGAIGVAPAALITPALPILVKIKALLAKLGIKTSDIKNAITKTAKKVAQKQLQKLNAGTLPNASDTATEQASETADKIVNATQQTASAEMKTSATKGAEDTQTSSDTEAKEVEQIMPSNTNWLLIGGVVAGALLLPKILKRK